MMPTPLILTLPGWMDSGPAHWQSLWEREHGDLRVTQHDYLAPKRGDWMARLDAFLLDTVLPTLKTGQPLCLAAHSLGCHLVAAWAAHSALKPRIDAAMLVAPPDVTKADWPVELRSWRPAVLQALPFNALVLASADDPFASLAAQQSLAHAWGAGFEALGNLGHLNADSGLGDWPWARQRLVSLLKPV